MKGKTAVAYSYLTEDSGIIISISKGSVTLAFRMQWRDWFENVQKIHICLIWPNTTNIAWGTIICNV